LNYSLNNSTSYKKKFNALVALIQFGEGLLKVIFDVFDVLDTHANSNQIWKKPGILSYGNLQLA